MKAKRVEVLMSIDALGWGTVDRFDFLSDEFPCRYPVRMPFRYFCTAIPTILCGCRPEERGYLSFYYYDKKDSLFKIFTFLPLSNLQNAHWNHGRVRGWISRIFRAMTGYFTYFQRCQMPFDGLKYFDGCAKNNLFVPNGMALAPVRKL